MDPVNPERHRRWPFRATTAKISSNSLKSDFFFMSKILIIKRKTFSNDSFWRFTKLNNGNEKERTQKRSKILMYLFKGKRCEFVVQGSNIRLIFTHNHTRWFKCCPTKAFKRATQRAWKQQRTNVPHAAAQVVREAVNNLVFVLHHHTVMSGANEGHSYPTMESHFPVYLNPELSFFPSDEVLRWTAFWTDEIMHGETWKGSSSPFRDKGASLWTRAAPRCRQKTCTCTISFF